jgi:hypothetical protein
LTRGERHGFNDPIRDSFEDNSRTVCGCYLISRQEGIFTSTNHNVAIAAWLRCRLRIMRFAQHSNDGDARGA